jgi:hypothetical protein
VNALPVKPVGVSSPGRSGPAVLRLAVAVLLTLLLAVVLASAAAADTGIESTESLDCLPPSEPSLPATRVSTLDLISDWDHIVQVVGFLRFLPPPHRVVYLLGGSATRESVISESGWAAQLRKLSGGSATTYVCASSCQTFVEDALIVNQLPEKRGTVLISVGTSRFLMLHKPASLPQYSLRKNAPAPWYQHHYDRKRSLPYAKQRRRVHAWVKDSYPIFQARYQDRLTELEAVITACETRGLRPALLEMPLNVPVIGDDFHDALATYRKACLELANEHDIEYIRFLSTIGLRGTDFYDLQHLLPSGREKWQARLSRELVRRHLL